MKIRFFSLALLGIAAAHAGTTIDPAQKYAYSANSGWINFAADDTNGVVVTETFLSGYAYAANLGWIHLGDGSPNNGFSYSNASATDYGVNMDSQGRLTGYAWAPNIGWINFEQTHGQPTMNFLTGKLNGYAWGANIGWISLVTTYSDLVNASISSPDTDSDDIGDTWEMLSFGNLTNANMTSDYDGDGQTDSAEYLAGTNPLDADSRFQISQHSYTDDGMTIKAQLTFTSAPNRLYSIESSATLQAPWTDSALGTFEPSAGSSTYKSITHPGGTKRFFRVLAHKPLQR